MNHSIFKAYDIRGVYPDKLNEENTKIITQAIYQFFTEELKKKELTIVVGRDMRTSSPSLSKIVKETLLDIGATVVDIDLVSTPTVYFTVYNNRQYDAGIQISASHNPKEYNGLKFFYKQGNKIIKVSKDTGMNKVKDLSIKNQFFFEKKSGKLITKTDAVKEEVDYVLKTLNPQIKNYKIVADPANSMGAPFIEELFKRTNCQLIKINFDLDGNFPSHEANPQKFETLKQLQKKVIEEKADFGIATDGDGDRIFFVDEKGQVIPATLISSLIAREILKKNKNEKILVDIRYTRNTSKLVKNFGGEVIFNVVGHSLITKKLNEVGGAFSGESSGHFFFREIGGAENAIIVICYILDVLSKTGKKLSALTQELLSSYESGEYNFHLPKNITSKQVLEKISKDYKDGEINWMDGLSIDYPHWRFNIRSSNTEPLLRLNLEADNEDLMKEKLEEIKSKILAFGAKLN